MYCYIPEFENNLISINKILYAEIMFSLNVKWIVSGTIGVNGPHVLRLVEKEYTKEKGLKHGKPKMEESHVLGITRKQNHAKNENVQVFGENSSLIFVSKT